MEFEQGDAFNNETSLAADLALIDHYDVVIRDLELTVLRRARGHDLDSYERLKTIPGIGKVLALTILYEIHDIRRFASVGQFVSYARLVRGSHESAGKVKGSPNKKIGNAHLKWAFSEAVPLLKRECPEANALAKRIEKKENKARANSHLAVKLGRAVYYMLRKELAFDIGAFLK